MTPSRCRFLVGPMCLALAYGCVGDGSDVGAPPPLVPPSAGASAVLPPTTLHAVMLESGRLRVVFTRSEDDDPAHSTVSRYLVCTPHACRETATNYLDLEGPDGVEGTPVVAYAVDAAGIIGVGSAPLPHDTPVLQPSAVLPTVHSGDPGTSLEVAQVVPPPTLVYSPVYGPFTRFGRTSATNTTSGPWSFWQHQSGFHRAGGGIGGADDTYAEDINLNVTGAGPNMDRNAEILAAGYGYVSTYVAGRAPGTDAARSILVDHNGWFSGYLHAATVLVRANDYVTPWTVLGRIGRSGTDNDHLHFVAYGPRVNNVLRSYPVNFVQNPVALTLTAGAALGVGQSRTIAASASRNHAAGLCLAPLSLNSSTVFNNTWWKSSNTRVFTVDGNGLARAIARGSATITVWYGGTSATTTLTVQ